MKLRGKTGDGISSLGVKPLDNGLFELKAVNVIVEGEPRSARKAGMGGPRYVRACAEAAVLFRGGKWLPEAVSRAPQFLRIVDSGMVAKAEFVEWRYMETPDGEVSQIGSAFWGADKLASFEHRRYPEKDIDWRSLFELERERSAEEAAYRDLKNAWVSYAKEELTNYVAGKGTTGGAVSALLAKQAVLERFFLTSITNDEESAWPLFHELVAARYIRTLCLLHRCEKTRWEQEILWPDITELGRTILLLFCCGWLKEANELAHRAKHMILSHQNQFVPLVPWFGIVWGTQNAEILAKGAVSKFHHPTYEDVAWVLRNWKGDDLSGLAERLARIADRRRRMMGQFDDDYHIDFDDGFSWTVPYEVGAVLMARMTQGLPVPEIDHPIFSLPTAKFELAPGPVTHFQDVYARFVREV